MVGGVDRGAVEIESGQTGGRVMRSLGLAGLPWAAKGSGARSFLLKLESRGLIRLPPLREAYRKPRAQIGLANEGSVPAQFGEVGLVSVEPVAAGTEACRQ